MFAREPQWSPDGGKIAFTGSKTRLSVNTEIYVMNADGSNMMKLTDDPAEDRLPAWLPDEQAIAFISERDDVDVAYIVNSDGSNLRRLADIGAEPLPEGFPELPGLSGGVAWSPSRTRITFYSGTNIVVMNADGTDRTSLPYAMGWERMWGAIPSWSPDETRIVFMSGFEGNIDEGNYEIYVCEIDGSNLLRLTKSRTDDWFPAWAPDGKAISYITEGGGIDNEQGGLYIVELGPVTATDVAERPIELPPDVAIDKAALLALYAAADGPNWKYSTNWLSDRPLGDWYGVTTDSGGRVIKLELQANQLDGLIPNELGNLTSLTLLNLSSNELPSGIPREFGNLTNLTLLNLRGNALTGPIPIELGNLSKLTVLELSYNSLNGQIPVGLSELANLTELRLLVNRLDGQIPAQLGSLANLEVLLLDGNAFSGEIPAALSDLSNLEALYLGNNALTGGIPIELSKLSNLRTLDLHRNQLHGTIPPELGLLSELRWLRLYENELSGTVPTELGHLSNLQSLNISWNMLSGQLPMSLTNLRSMRSFWFSGNSELCAPPNDEFQAWLRSTLEFSGDSCAG